MKTTRKSTVTTEINVNTYDKGDDTIIFRSTDDGEVWVKEMGKDSRAVELKTALDWMVKLYLDGYRVTTTRQKMAA
jgi:hypothetical protein